MSAAPFLHVSNNDGAKQPRKVLEMTKYSPNTHNTKKEFYVNSFMTEVPIIETSLIICSANHWAGFYIIGEGFESRWMSIELACHVKTITVFISFTTSFVSGIL